MAKFNLTVQLQLQSPANIGTVVANLQKQLGSIGVPITVKVNTRQIKAASTAIGLVNTESISADKSVQKLGGTLGIAARRFGAISIATGSFLAFTRAVKNSVGEAIVFQRELNKIEQTTGASARSITELRDRVFELSKGLGVSSQELVVAARTLAQAGFSAKTASGALEILSQTDLAATFNSIQDTTEGSIALLQQFGREAIKAGQEVKFLEQSLSSINAVSKAFAVESADIISAIRKTGGSFEAAGGSINELIALFTSVRATTRESADTIATAFRTIFTRIQRVDTIDKLKEMGIVLQDTEGKFVGPLAAIEALSSGLSVLDTKDFRFSQVIEELGGFRQIGKVIPLLKQFAVTQDALNVAQGASGGLAKDAETAQKSLAVQIVRVREEFKAMVEGFTETAVFGDFATGALNLASALIKVAEAIKPILPLITILAGLKLGQVLGGFAGITGKGGLISNLVGGQRKATGGTVKKFAAGGLVPVMLMPGEIALDRSGVAKAGGISELNKINKMKPTKYAGGGFVGPVPGSGNADTFATAMEPGGFVIRKRAVKALQAQQPKKMALGGGIQSETEIGALTLDPDYKTAKRQFQPIVLKAGDFAKRGESAAQGKFKADRLGFRENQSYNLKVFGINNSQYEDLSDRVKQNLIDGLARTINDTAAAFDPDLNIKAPVVLDQFKDKFAKSIGQGTVGAMFEAMVASISDRTFDSAADQGRPFDFVGSIGDAGRLFSPGSESIKYKDAKSTISSIKPSNFKSKIIRTAAEGAGPIKGTENILTSLKQQAQKSGRVKDADGMYNLDREEMAKQLEAMGVGNQKIRKSSAQILDLFRESGFSEKDINTADIGKSGKKIFKFANGGKVLGLTMSGETILSKKAAHGIGYDTLDAINKSGKVPGNSNKDDVLTAMDVGGYVINKAATKKYAQGGRVQRFARGGSVDTLNKQTDAIKVKIQAAQQQAGLQGTPFTRKDLESIFLEVERDFGGLHVALQKRAQQLAQQNDAKKAPISPELASQRKESVLIRASNELYAEQAAAIRKNVESIKALNKLNGVTADSQEIYRDAILQVGESYGALHGEIQNKLNKTNSIISAKNDFTGPPAPSRPGLIARYKDKLVPDFKSNRENFDAAFAKSKESGTPVELGGQAKGLATNFLFMGGAVASIIPQLGIFEKSTADAATQAAATATAFYGIGGTLLEGIQGPLGKLDGLFAGKTGKFSQFIKSFGGFSNILPGALAGVAAGIGAVQFVVSKLNAEAAKAGESAKAELKQVSETGTGSLESVTDNLLKAANLQNKAAKFSAYGTGGAIGGAVLGAAIGSAIPVFGTVVGGVVGGIVGGLGGGLGAGYAATQGENFSTDNQVGAIQASAKAQYVAAKATYDFSKALKDAEENGLDGKATLEVFAGAASKFADDVAVVKLSAEETESQTGQQDDRNVWQRNMSTWLGGSTERLSEASKANLEAAKEAKKASVDFATQKSTELRGQIATRVGDTLSQSSKSLTFSEVLDQSDIKASLDSYVELLGQSGLSEEEAIARIASLNESIYQATESSKKLAEAETRAKAIRMAELDLLNKVNAAMGAMVQSSEVFSREQLNITRTLAAANGSFEFAAPDYSNLFGDLTKIGDFSDFADSVRSIAKPLGAAGDTIANEILSASVAINKLKVGLAGPAASRLSISKEAGPDAFEAFLSGIIGEDAFKGLNEDLRKSLRAQFNEAAGASGFSEEAKDKFIKSVEDSTKAFTDILDRQAVLNNQYLSQYSSVITGIIDAAGRQRDALSGLADIQERGSSRLDEVFKGRISSGAIDQTVSRKEQSRTTKAQTKLALPIQAGNITQVSRALNDFQRAIAQNNQELKTTKDVNRQKELGTANLQLADQAKRAREELQRLSDQSEKAADVMSQIQREQAKREFVSNRVEDFVLGTTDQRTGMNQVAQGAQVVAQTGSFQGVPEEVRKSVGDFLKQLGDLNPGGLADNIRKNALANDIQSFTGVDRGTAVALADKSSTTQEEKFIQDLRGITAQEIAAQQALIAAQQENTNSMGDLLTSITQNFDDIGRLFREEMQNRQAEITAQAQGNPQRVADAEAASKAEATKAEAEKKQRNEVFTAEAGSALKAAMGEAATSAGSKIADALVTAGPNIGAAIVQGMSSTQGHATGGIVYRADGGNVFKPKGTDTVPAMLTPGEFVVRKSAVDHYGEDTLRQINNKTLYAAGGGAVGGAFGNSGQKPFTKEMMSELATRFQSLSIQSYRVDPSRMVSDINDLLAAIDSQNIEKDSRLEKYKALLAANRDRFQRLAGGRSQKASDRDQQLASIRPGFVSSEEKDARRAEQFSTGIANRQDRQDRKAAATTRVLGEREARANSRRDYVYKEKTFLSELEKDRRYELSGYSTVSGNEEEVQLINDKFDAKKRIRSMLLDDKPATPYAKGGSVMDTVPAMLTPGEYVVNASAVSKYGNDFMNSINNKVVGYNKGGPVYKAGGGSIPDVSGGSGQMLGIDTSSLQSVFTGFTNTLKGNLENLLTQLPQNITSSMKTITDTMANIVQGFNNMKWTMEHNFNGSIAIAGLNVPEMAEMLKNAVTTQVTDLINAQMNTEANKFKQG